MVPGEAGVDLMADAILGIPVRILDNDHHIVPASDDQVLDMLKDAHFAPGASLTLPSGKKINPNATLLGCTCAFTGEEPCPQHSADKTIRNPDEDGLR